MGFWGRSNQQMSTEGPVQQWAKSPLAQCLAHRSSQQTFARSPLLFLEDFFPREFLLSCATWVLSTFERGHTRGSLPLLKAYRCRCWCRGDGGGGHETSTRGSLFSRIPQIPARPAICWVLVPQRCPKHNSCPKHFTVCRPVCTNEITDFISQMSWF